MLPSPKAYWRRKVKLSRHARLVQATPCLACLSTVREPIIRLLESRGIRRLYPQNYEHRKELKKLNHSLLVNFLDMVDVLIRCPDTSKRLVKKEDMSLLFVRVHHLIEFRPHQTFGRHSQVMLDMQRWQRLDTAHRFHKELDKSETESIQAPKCGERAHGSRGRRHYTPRR
ncbi:hypothetical protein HPB49_003716 [Dermacentor silvarum]|uniref:Uncharacterized protein n=1 Tax=Dermacentor silvarum TaxID=543639 RepID=A0ACB8DTI6_DERSI|nr:hypothetical protein HPB49_003716 [Dermacentor silvarum]